MPSSELIARTDSNTAPGGRFSATDGDALVARIATLEAAQEQGFNMLSLYGVPEERARSVANGISVLVTRYDREIQSLTAAITALAAEKRDAERYRWLRSFDRILAPYDPYVTQPMKGGLEDVIDGETLDAAIDAALAANGATDA